MRFEHGPGALQGHPKNLTVHVVANVKHVANLRKEKCTCACLVTSLYFMTRLQALSESHPLTSLTLCSPHEKMRQSLKTRSKLPFLPALLPFPVRKPKKKGGGVKNIKRDVCSNHPAVTCSKTHTRANACVQAAMHRHRASVLTDASAVVTHLRGRSLSSRRSETH